MSEEWIDVAAATAIADDEYETVMIDDVSVLVFKLTDGFYAIEDLCTHDHLPLAGGCVENGEIMCPFHGARFCIKSGEALSAPAYEAVGSYPVRVHEGRVQVSPNRQN